MNDLNLTQFVNSARVFVSFFFSPIKISLINVYPFYSEINLKLFFFTTKVQSKSFHNLNKKNDEMVYISLSLGKLINYVTV